jgi:hypothetical protein
MPGCHVSAKRLGHIRGGFDAVCHNSKPSSADCKPTGPADEAAALSIIRRRGAGSTRFCALEAYEVESSAAFNTQFCKQAGSALELVEEVDGARREHAEERDTHCHCEIHRAS